MLLQNVNKTKSKKERREAKSKKERREAWMLKNIDKPEPDGCSFASDKYPPCILDSKISGEG